MQYLSAWAHGRCVCLESCEHTHPHTEVKVVERRLIRESNNQEKELQASGLPAISPH